MKDRGADKIKAVEIYRGVEVHDCQPAERIEDIVKPDIDAAFELNSIADLIAFARNHERAPEARLLAAAKCEAKFQLAAAHRETRPNLSLQELRATVAGLDSRSWRSPYVYGSLFDTHPPGEAAKIARPDEYREMVEADAGESKAARAR